jgi:POT family proton-dependent oligopeptide transporter
MSDEPREETGEQPEPEADDTPKGHPKGLYYLFATEMWERFSYYGMRALLVLYLVQHLGWLPRDSSSVYKWYTSLVYLTPLLGGYLADRYLGLRNSIIIGGVLMGIGHFLMAFEPLPFLFAALGFLIVGNGFFKPNISTLVGKLYTPTDKRRDGAFTIFYMGINLGAGLSPLVCGWLRTKFGFHYGFAAAGVGMMIGLAVFITGRRQILADVHAAGNVLETARERDKREGVKKKGEHALEPDETKAGEGGVAGTISRVMPYLLMVAAIALPAQYAYKVITGEAKWHALIMPIAFGAVAGLMGVTLRTIKGAARDKSIVIFVLFFFSVLFWMAFEQAGNALNLWAEYHTKNRVGSFEHPAEWWQSVNAALIVIFAPIFTAFWLFLARRRKELSTPAKMLVAMVFMATSFVAMLGAAVEENAHVSTAKLAAVPEKVEIGKLAAGRLTFDAGKQELSVKGVLPPFQVNQILEPTLADDYKAAVKKLEDEAANASAKNPVKVVLPKGPGFELSFEKKDEEGFLKSWDAATGTIEVVGRIGPETKVKLYSAGAPAEYRAAVSELAEKSKGARASGFWLFLSYLLATLGELCISPVGLSMVTKLAPARFASLFMGVWLLTSSVAQYVGGSLGESWGEITPQAYFNIFVWTSVAGAVVLVLLVLPLKKLMHGVDDAPAKAH